MAIKCIYPDDTYIVREMFGCGHGHCMPPGFTHWESGEACIHGHSQEYGPGYGPGPTDNESYHLYWRLMAVPVADANGGDCWERIQTDPNKWCHFPPAPEGLKEGTRIGGDKVKLKRGAKLSKEVKKKYKLKKTEIIYYDPPEVSAA